VVVVAGIGVIVAIIIMLTNSSAFVPNDNKMVAPHLQWLYGDNYKSCQVGYGKGVGLGIKVIGVIQNKGSKNDDSLSGSWDYKKVMRELHRQSGKEKIHVQVGDQSYILKNSYRDGPYELGYKLTDQIYESIRESDTDICDIIQNLGFKANNIKNVKDYVFYNEHDLDRYGSDERVRKQFDPNLRQALAWKRLESGNHT